MSTMLCFWKLVNPLLGKRYKAVVWKWTTPESADWMRLTRKNRRGGRTERLEFGKNGHQVKVGTDRKPFEIVEVQDPVPSTHATS